MLAARQRQGMATDIGVPLQLGIVAEIAVVAPTGFAEKLESTTPNRILCSLTKRY
jgi:hypothetical protein